MFLWFALILAAALKTGHLEMTFCHFPTLCLIHICVCSVTVQLQAVQTPREWTWMSRMCIKGRRRERKCEIATLHRAHLSRGVSRRRVSRHVKIIIAEKEKHKSLYFYASQARNEMQEVYYCVCVFTCLCLRPPRASHLGSGLKRNNLYWALPTCGERKEEQRERG